MVCLHTFAMLADVHMLMATEVFCVYLEIGIVWHGRSDMDGITQIFRIF
jgi:hypothetical protein